MEPTEGLDFLVPYEDSSTCRLMIASFQIKIVLLVPAEFL